MIKLHRNLYLSKLAKIANSPLMHNGLRSFSAEPSAEPKAGNAEDWGLDIDEIDGYIKDGTF